MQIVWFKRDLRIFDNEVFNKACENGPFIPLYIIEEELWRKSSLSIKHYYFLRESLNDLNIALEKIGHSLILEKGSCIEIFKKYKIKYGLTKVWSHEETWNNWVRNRNENLSKWFKKNNINWIELPQNGVIKNLSTRNGWSRKWKSRMNKSIFYPVSKIDSVVKKKYVVPSYRELDLNYEKNNNFVIGGRLEGLKLLNKFLFDSGENYSSDMSSPVTAYKACSKLSSHISFGTLSIKEIYQSSLNRILFLKNESSTKNKKWIKSLRSFVSRLHWHCHFIQKIEDDPKLEFKNMHSLYDGIRESSFNKIHFKAWKQGLTGYPFLDACMRALKFNGWINFRMRAMLMSFASYHLWLHWKETSEYLASLFIDFEPGIHYAQSQMQSGTTGINSIRIYNPIKQSKEHDPDGLFIRKWVPELARIAKKDIHTPWLTNINLKNYPKPIVEEKIARLKAAKKVYSIRGAKKFFKISENIYNKHGSRKSEFKINKEKIINKSKQLNLF